jgi:predicted DNA-binding transcriptional regulator AlpA
MFMAEVDAAMKILSYRGVVEHTSLSESTVRRLVAAGRFPKPVNLTPGRKGFPLDAVDEAMSRLIHEANEREPVTRG